MFEYITKPTNGYDLILIGWMSNSGELAGRPSPVGSSQDYPNDQLIGIVHRN